MGAMGLMGLMDGMDGMDGMGSRRGWEKRSWVRWARKLELGAVLDDGREFRRSQSPPKPLGEGCRT